MVECEAKKDREMNGWTEKMDDGWESWRERERERGNLVLSLSQDPSVMSCNFERQFYTKL